MVSIDAVRLRGGLIVRGNGRVLGCIVVVPVGDGLNGMLSAGFELGILSLRGGRPRAYSSSSSSLGRFIGRPGGVGRRLICDDEELGLIRLCCCDGWGVGWGLLGPLGPGSSSGDESSSSSASRWKEAGLRRGREARGANAPEVCRSLGAGGGLGGNVEVGMVLVVVLL